MSSSLIYEFKEKESKIKVRDYLKHNMNLSGRFIKAAGLSGRIKVNGKVVKLNYVLIEGDKIEIKVSKDESQNITPEKMDLDVVYEDCDLIVINKKPYIIVHPTRSHQTGTLSNGLLYYFKEKGENCIVRLVSRLDRDTSGLIIIAKNQFSHMALARDMEKDTFEKSYLAIAHGNFENKSGTIDLPIGRPNEESLKRTVNENGQRSITHYKVIEAFKDAQLVELTLETGRTHQIRVHLNHLGYTIFGDTLYGKEEKEYIQRQALHAYKLIIPHPRTGEKLVLEAKLPEDMKELIQQLRG